MSESIRIRRLIADTFLLILFIVGLAVLFAGCGNQKAIGTAPSVTAPAEAPPGKTRATPLEFKTTVKSAVGVGSKTCYEDGGGLIAIPVDRQTTDVTNANSDCTWRNIFAAYGIPPGATDTAQQHWLAGVYYEVAPGEHKRMTVGYSPCRDQWTVRFQTDVWALRRRPNDTDQPLPKQFNQDGVGLHEFGGHEWETEACAAIPTPPQPPAPPTPPQPQPPVVVGPVCPASGRYDFPDGTWLQHNGEPDYHDRTAIVPVDIPAAKWRITLTLWDEHSAKPAQKQTGEQSLLYAYQAPASLPVDPAMGPTPDIPEDRDLWPFTFTPRTLPRIIGLQVVHAGPAAGIDSFMVKSIEWTCLEPIPVAVKP